MPDPDRSAVQTLVAAGFEHGDAQRWAAAGTDAHDGFQAGGHALGELARFTAELERRMPEPRTRSAEDRRAAAALAQGLAAARAAWLTLHAEELYDALTERRSRRVRVERLVIDAGRLVPGLTPTEAELAAERRLPLAEKTGVELAQALVLEHVLALPQAGTHLVESMLAPTARALDLLPELRARGEVDLGAAIVRRRGAAGLLEHRNVRHLNAEDDTTLEITETAVDLILLDPEIEVGVIRGAVVDHPRYAGQRVFGAGINLTRLYRGQIDYLFYMVRDLGYVSKLYRGLVCDGPPGTVEKLWIAAVEVYAIGGACQLLHVVDHVIASRGSRLFLPARKEGIIPGASNLRLPRSVGDRAARQAILSGREWVAGEPDAMMLIDELVEPGEMDAALDARTDALTSSGLVNAAANRRALRIGEEPLDIFRQYMSLFAREQALCHLSPALVSNLERHWNAANRGD